MSNTLTEIPGSDRRGRLQVDALLEREGIRRDGNLDYTCGIFDDDWELIATGSCFGSTIRCLAVSGSHRGEGLLNQIVSHLVEVQLARGSTHLFLYTKPDSAQYLSDLGFYEIARVPGSLVFMENRRGGFERYCAALAPRPQAGQSAAGIVMNANPFNLGHRHLVERAARENDVVHLFVLSEESGPIPSAVRRELVEQGVQDLPNVFCHATGPYLISSATFPSYFLKDSDAVIRTQAELDLRIFCQIAQRLGIQRRYVGEERASHVTRLYNEVMGQKLPEAGIQCVEIPRLTRDGAAVSASAVRQAIHDGQLDRIRDWVPPSTYDFFTGPRGASVRAAIQREADVIHY